MLVRRISAMRPLYIFCMLLGPREIKVYDWLFTLLILISTAFSVRAGVGLGLAFCCDADLAR